MAMTSAAVLYDRITDCGVFVKTSHIGVSQYRLLPTVYFEVYLLRHIPVTCQHLVYKTQTTPFACAVSYGSRPRLRAHACIIVSWIIAVLVRYEIFWKVVVDGCVAVCLCSHGIVMGYYFVVGSRPVVYFVLRTAIFLFFKNDVGWPLYWCTRSYVLRTMSCFLWRREPLFPWRVLFSLLC